MTIAPRVGIRPPLAVFEHGTGPLRAFVEQVDAAGLDHLCVGDHVSFRDGYGYDGLVQATALAVLSPLPVHTAVYLLLLRNPVTVARQLSSLAQLAPGRLVFGVGLGGDDPHELEVCGVDPRTRGRRMNDCLAIVRALLAGETVDHDGEVLSVHGARVMPAPAGARADRGGWSQRRRPPTRRPPGRRVARRVRHAGTVGARHGPRVETTARELGRTDVTWEHGLSVWVGFGESRDDAAPRLAAAMEDLYHRPFRELRRVRAPRHARRRRGRSSRPTSRRDAARST